MSTEFQQEVDALLSRATREFSRLFEQEVGVLARDAMKGLNLEEMMQRLMEMAGHMGGATGGVAPLYSGVATGPTPYDLLGLEATATEAEVRARYYDLAMRLHPDKSPNTEQLFRLVKAAYEAIMQARGLRP